MTETRARAIARRKIRHLHELRDRNPHFNLREFSMAGSPPAGFAASRNTMPIVQPDTNGLGLASGF